MKKKTIYLLVNGILNFPGSSKNWNGRGVTWIMTKTPYKAEKIEYFCGIIGRAFGQRKRIRKLYKTLLFYKDWNIILVGHSNGCSVITEMFKQYQDIPIINSIHLIAGASEADFAKNGFNRLLKEQKINKINIYVAGKDYMLRLAKFGRWLGYKTLGLHGAYNVHPSIKNRVKEVWTRPWTHYGHSTCFEDNNFDKTMKLLI